MANYSILASTHYYTGSGGFKVDLCVKYWPIYNYPHLWSVGDIVFIKDEAYRGILEKIAIKEVRVVSKKSIYGKFYFLYLDTNNRLWEENELVSEYNALLIAKNYFERQIAFTVSAAKNCPA